MISKSALLSSYEYVLNVIKDRIIEDVLVDYYSEDTDDIRFDQEIYNEKVESYILNAFSDVDLVVLVDSGLIVSKIETLGKFYSVEGFAKKVVEDIDYKDIKREIAKNAEEGILEEGDASIYFKEAVVLNSQDYEDIVSKIEKDVILEILDRLEDGELEISDSLLYSLVDITMLKNLGDVDFVLLTEYETINSDVEIPVIAYSLNKFCDKIVNEIYDSVKRGVEDVTSENFEEDDPSSYMKI
jgi:hypothetical protein